MIRVILLNLFLLVLPALLYFLYVFVLRRLRGQESKVESAPLFWLFATGMILMVASLAYYAEFEGERGSGVYRPPSYQDGVVRPGRVE
jgi:heme/copper-type cytochrome/quinol oxidase subunit 1